YKLTDFAVLFRTNAQSRPFEEELLRANLPYSVVGGVKFYERAEIKDILSFVRLAVRPHDTPSVERVINVPSRGIGDTTLKAREVVEQNPSASLADYLDSLTLMSDLDRYQSEKGVTLMTLHAAKGLEFKIVFLAGMEEGILPHSQSLEENDDIEEERRLCYVGMTRAREQLYCLYALERRVHGMMRDQRPSAFVQEIPDQVKEEVRLGRRFFGGQPTRQFNPQVKNI